MDAVLTVNGFESAVHFDDESIQNIFLPLLEQLSRRQRRMRRRLIAFLAAPPGVGKSTLAAFLETLSRKDGALVPLQAMGMDGFHYPQNYILSHTVSRDGLEIPMCQIKGAPETFDVEKLRGTLCASLHGDPLWPFYDRRLHDVVESAVRPNAPILLVEGNWLLLKEAPWQSLPRDFSLFIDADASQLRDRLIRRKIRGGLSPDEAARYYDRCDGPNIARCRSQSLPADLRLTMVGDGKFSREF